LPWSRATPQAWINSAQAILSARIVVLSAKLCLLHFHKR
jgi:hypothetical protein